jgi:hypothetical protein
MIPRKPLSITFTILLALAAIVTVSFGQATKTSDTSNIERAVLARLAEIQSAAEALDPDKVFSYVLENDKGSLAQNGVLLLTRKEALESTRRGFQGLKKVAYTFDQQHVTVISPTVALATGEGSSSFTTTDGRVYTTRFAQSVVFVLTNGEWKVLHSHRSFPTGQ